MRKMWRTGTALLLAAVMTMAAGVCAFADTQDNNPADGEITIDENDRPFLSLGADLTSEEKETVLGLFGITTADLENYDVITVTNEQEHQYLGEYIPAQTIGSRALSSVVVMEGKKGSGIQVTTKNITYCTKGMYANALATAGVEDAEVIVAGPFELSGTAALLGAIEAYSVMTGDDVDEQIVDGAVEEIVVTGKLEEETGSTQELEGMIAYLKDQVADKEMSDAEMSDAVKQAAQQFNVTLTQEQIDEIIGLLQKLQGLDLDWDKIGRQAENIYDQLKEMGIDFSSEEFAAQAQGFFAKLLDFLRGLFQR